MRRAPPGRPPGAIRPPPRFGGFGPVAAPPELRRRMQGGCRAAPGAADVEDRMRLTLNTAQRKLLVSRESLEATVAALRAQLAGEP